MNMESSWGLDHHGLIVRIRYETYRYNLIDAIK